MKVKLATNIQSDSILDGEGIRAVVWFQGCSHHCKACHNPETWDFNSGFEIDLEDLKKQIDELEYQNGITLSGGDPFYQADAATEVAKYAHEKNLNVWAYTGFLFEELLNVDKYKKLLENIDVLIDGKFEEENMSLECKFRGSTNQRIIDVPKSLEQKKVVLYYGD